MEKIVNSYICGDMRNIHNLINVCIEETHSNCASLYENSVNKHEMVLSIPSIDEIRYADGMNQICFKIYDSPSSSLSQMMVCPIVCSFEDTTYVLCLGRYEGKYSCSKERIDSIIKLFSIMLDTGKYFSVCEKKMCSEDLFLANMSHEIRTPLNGVIGYNQLLVQTTLDNTQQRYLKCMNECSVQLLHIINDILDFSKLSSGNMCVETECFSILEIKDAVENSLGERILSKKQNLRFEIDPNFPDYIILDKQKFIQILINLLSNAIKFTSLHGDVSVSFSLSSDGVLVTQVRDSGIGISENDMLNLFNIFSQVRDSGDKTGSGLGLAIVKKLVKLLGGYIKVSSLVNVGTVFTFTCKYKKYEDFEKIINKELGDLEFRKILIVDDDPNNRILLSEMVYSFNMIPLVCASPLEALSLVSSNRHIIDIGLIDICMPDMAGTELACKIKDENMLIPLIALSSLDSFVATPEFEGKLYKPINRVQLFHIISRTLQKPGSIPRGNTVYNMKKNAVSRILIAEDVRHNQDLLRQMLINLGFNDIDISNDGVEALEKMKEVKYDLLLLDIRMPILDGYKVIEAINLMESYSPIIIMITACVMDEVRKKCENAGVNYFITKPIEYAQLKNVISHAISNN